MNLQDLFVGHNPRDSYILFAEDKVEAVLRAAALAAVSTELIEAEEVGNPSAVHRHNDGTKRFRITFREQSNQ